MLTYKLQNRPIQPSYTLDVMAKGYSTMEQGHQQAIDTASKLKTAVANLPMNTAEDGYKQALLNSINKTIEDNTLYGNSYAALDDIVKQSGDISSNPGVLGRIKAQQEYSTYNAKVDARNDISDDVKRYSKAMNPYYYQDKLDDKGNVIGGSEWKPTFNPVKSYDLNDIFARALQYIKPDQGSYEKTQFIDANGNVTSKYTPGGSVARYNTFTQSWEKLSEDKIRTAVNAVMNANPAITASLHQDYDVEKWKYDNKEATSGYLNQDGSQKTFDQYLEDKIAPFARAAAYNKTVSKNNYNDAILNKIMASNIEKQKAVASGGGIGTMSLIQAVQNAPEYQGGNIVLEDTSRPDNIVRSSQLDAIVKDVLTEATGDASFADGKYNGKNIDEALKYLQSQPESKERNRAIGKLNQAKMDFADVMKTHEIISANINDEDTEAILRVYDAIKNNLPLDESIYGDSEKAKAIADKQNELYAQVFGNHQNVAFGTKKQNEIDAVINLLSNGEGQTALEREGYTFTTDNKGRHYINVPSDKKYKIRELFQSVGKVKGSNWIGDLFRSPDVYWNDDGDYKKATIIITATQPGVHKTPSRVTVEYIISDSALNEAQKKITPYTQKDNFIYPTKNIKGGTSFQVSGYTTERAAIDAGDTKALTFANKVIKSEDERIFGALRDIGLTNTNVEIFDTEQNKFVKPSRKKLKEIQDFIQTYNGNDSNKTFEANTQFAAGKYNHLYTITEKNKDKVTSYRFTIKGGEDDPVYKTLNNSYISIAENELIMANNNGEKALSIGYMFDYDNSGDQNFMLVPNQNNTFSIIDRNNQKYGDVSMENAIALRATYNQLKDSRDASQTVGLNAIQDYIAKNIIIFGGVKNIDDIVAEAISINGNIPTDENVNQIKELFGIK